MSIQENKPTVDTTNPKHILVVEPDQGTQKLLTEMIDGYSIEHDLQLDVQTADSIVSAMSKLAPDQANVDLMLTDWNLPDGKAGSLLGMKEIQRPPTLVISGKEMLPPRITDPQVKGVLPKPFDIDQLYQSMDPFLRNKQQP